MPVIRQKRSGNITKSGAITILPKNQIKEIDSLQDTIPVDLSINGHKLTNTNIRFDDSKNNYIFNKNYLFDNITEGVPSIDNFSGNLVSTPNTVGTSFAKSSFVSKGFLKDPRQKNRLNISFSPYKEENQISVSDADDFYIKGTSPLIAANFQQSLQSRENIQINFDMQGAFDDQDTIGSIIYDTPSSPGETGFGSLISYFNFANKEFEGLDARYLPPHLGVVPTSTISQDPEYFTLAFSPCTYLPGDEFFSGSYSEPVSNFGFPFSKKFSPSSQQLLDMSDYIDKPFYLEKIIIKCNVSHYGLIRSNTQGYPMPFAACTNFFIINQRNTDSNNKINENIQTITSMSSSGENIDLTFNSAFSDDYYENNVIRELVTYAKITSATTGTVDTTNDVKCQHALSILENESDSFVYVNSETSGKSGQPSDAQFLLNGEFQAQSVQIEIPVRTSLKNSNLGLLSNKKMQYYLSNNYGGRTLLGKDLGKSYKSNQTNSSVSKRYTSSFPSNAEYNIKEKYNETSPYILYPNDKLIFGFHSLSNVFDESVPLTLMSILRNNFLSVNLVGTPINNDRPKFEFDKRFLTSKNLRSGIIGNTFFTDEFDTLPIQFYASSSIDKIITTTGNKITNRAVSGYYSAGNKGTLLKAVELKNSDIFLTGSLLSEKIHFNYNSYGNFSDLYAQRKYTSYFKRGDNTVIYPVEKKFYSELTGNSLHQTGTLSFNSDFNSKISSPFTEA